MRKCTGVLLFALLFSIPSVHSDSSRFGIDADTFKMNNTDETFRHLVPSNLDLENMTQIVAGLIRDPTSSPVGSGACTEDLLVFFRAALEVREWAIAGLDAWYKPQSGILEGSVHWLGNYDECLRVQSTHGPVLNITDIPGINPIHRQHDFDMKYCRTWYTMPEIITFGGASVGTCFPSSCSSKDVSALLRMFGVTTAPIKKTYCGEKPDLKSDGGAITAILILTLFGVLVIVSTIVDIWKHSTAIVEKPAVDEAPQVNHEPGQTTDTELNEGVNQTNQNSPTNTTVMSGSVAENEVEENPGTRNTVIVENQVPKKTSKAGEWHNGQGFVDHNTKAKREPSKSAYMANTDKALQMLLSFSFKSNLPRVLSTSQPTGSYTCMNGLRFISMAWIILGHTWQLGLDVLSGQWEDFVTAENAFSQYRYQGRFLHNIVINNMSLAVETFFVLSGCLVTVSFLKQMKRQGGKVNCRQMGLYYFHRYWRLTPVYAIILMAYGTLFIYLGNGPLFPKNFPEAESCRSMWWRNLFYLNTLPAPFPLCMGWTWYLGNDFLYYLGVPLFAAALYRKPVVGIIMVVLGVTISTVFRVIILLVFGTKNYFWNIYFPPWTRFASYGLGIGLGYLLYRTNSRLRIHRAVLVVGWIGAICLYFIAVILNAYNPLVHFIGFRVWFSLAVIWIILVCSCGYGGFINRFLSWKLFVPLSRLTYVSYLIHPIIMHLYLYTGRRMVYVDDFSMVMNFCGNLTLSLVAALFITLMFEVPFANMEKVFLPSRRK